MGQRLAWLVGGFLLLAVVLAACNGGNGTSIANPTTGAEVCEGLAGAGQFRYAIDHVIESPKPTDPVDESAVGDPPFAVPPASELFRFEITYGGSFVGPDRLDFEFGVPGQPSVRKIRIGERAWLNLGGIWQEESAPIPLGLEFTPTRMCEVAISALDLSGVTGTVEAVGDTEARHSRFQGVPLETASRLYDPPSDMARLLKIFDVDVWLSEKDGRLVKLESVSTAAYPSGRELTMEIVLEVEGYEEEIVIEPPI